MAAYVTILGRPRRSLHPGPLVDVVATAHVRQGNIDEACRLGSQALDLAARQQVAPNLQHVRRLRLDLEPWRKTQAIKELDEQLALAG